MNNTEVKIKKSKFAIFSVVVMFFDWMYLSLSDCDGMCEHCNNELKMRCERRKSKY